MKVLALIPARGGSKGIPGKNIKLLGGSSLLFYTVKAALTAKKISRVIISTDDEQIAAEAGKLGVEVPFMRPASLATDNTPTLPVIQHALNFCLQRGESYDAVCLLQVTSPFRVPGFIDRAIEHFTEKKCDSLISVLPVPTEFNPHWTFEAQADGFLKIATGENKIISRRQDLPPAYFRDGSIYITKTGVLLEQHSLYGNTVGYIVNDSTWHVNIDTIGDWNEAERMIANYQELCAQ